MSLSKPYPNIYRHGPSGVILPYFDQWKSSEGINCLATYDLLKKDLRKIFDYVEPTGENLRTFSHRIYELLLRACTEVETLCKQVFEKNHVELGSRSNIIRYSDLNGPMRLDEYEILCYGFNHPPFCPFTSFAESNRSQRSPAWYRAYNDVKHHRSSMFECANLGNVIQAVGAIHVLLVSQFGLGFDHVMRLRPDGMMSDCPDMFRPKKLPEWSECEQYSFDWNSLKHSSQPYEYHPLPEIP